MYLDHLLKDIDTTNRHNSDLPVPSALIMETPSIYSIHCTSSSELDEEHVQRLLTMIAYVPYGRDVAEYLCWSDYYAHLLRGHNSDPLSGSLEEFLLRYDSEIPTHCPETRFYLSCCRVREASVVIALPAKLPSYPTLKTKLARRDYTSMAAALFASVIYSTNTAVSESSSRHTSTAKDATHTTEDLSQFASAIKSLYLELFESAGGLDALFKATFDTCFALPHRIGHVELAHMLFKTISSVTSTTLETIERFAVEYLTKADQPIYSENKHLRALISVGLSPGAMDKFVYLPSYSRAFLGSEALSAQSRANNGVVAATSDVVQQSFYYDAASLGPAVIAVMSADTIPLTTDTTIKNSTTTGDQYRHICELLQSEFQYDSSGNRPAVESPFGRKLRESLDLLSAKLYSSDVHFVMELLQNADDNKYNDTIIPTIKFELYPHAVVVYNNEVGFNLKNIVAVCNVGGSTKKGQHGYIGQKGK